MSISSLSSYLQAHPAQRQEQVIWHWHGYELVMRLTDHLSDEAPVVTWVTSVRCLVVWRGRVLVVQAPHHHHILPGGRREPGESLAETAVRETREETGWLVNDLRLVGFRHFHHLTPKPEPYPYLYPDFLQVIFTARAVEFQPGAKEIDGYELGSMMRPLKEIATFNLTPGEIFFLRASLNKWRKVGKTVTN